MQSPSQRLRLVPYLVLNICFVMAVMALAASGGSPNPRILHLILLFLVCSTPLIDLDGLNGRYILPSLFLGFYFVSFGLLDFVNLARGLSSEVSPSYFSKTEGVILVGAVMLTLGYRTMMLLGGKPTAARQERDWPMRTVLVVGISLWLIGTFELFYWNVFLIPDNSPESARKGLQALGPYGTAALLLARMLQPVGILLIAYAWRSTRSRLLFLLVLIAVVVQVVLGFTINVKGEAMIGGILVIVTYMLIDGRLPVGWLIGAALYGLIVFPIFVASRAEIHGSRQIARANILEDLVHTVELAIAAEDRVSKVDKTQNLLERTSVRGSLQMIVERTGVDVDFQHGATMTPLLATFIPRFIWTDKPDVATGRVVNKAFHVTEAEYSDTYISPSIPGELYWNFGWPGICIGMGIIGAAVGYLGQRYNLARAKTVTGLLVIVLTIKQVVVSLEGTFSPEYVVWFRSLGAVAVLHWLFARSPLRPLEWADGRASDSPDRRTIAHINRSTHSTPYPNLLR
jgi:hypothetical protein